MDKMHNNNIKMYQILLLLILVLPFGLILAGCGNKEEAAFNEAVRTGTKAMEDRDWNRAIEQFSKGLELKASDTGLLYQRAAAYLAKARDSYNLASAAASQNDMQGAEANAKNADSSFEHSKKDCLKMIELDARNADAWYVKGCVELYLGDWNGAIESFSTSIREKPDSPFAWQRRGEVYGHIGDNANSIIDLKKAAELGYVDTEKKKGTDH
ncbi:MAG: hypothetical protein PHQ75_00860 [Thermoguttaceae bacterium]|nr:hypothetical protein [Thermoguttaceae bacterium]